MRRFVAAALALVVLAACRTAPEVPGDDGIMCTMEARAGIMVEVVDSVSNASATRGSRIVARSAAHTDSTMGAIDSDENVALAFEQAGTYTVTVSKPGYRDWTRSGIVVTADRCHVQTVRVTARLQR